MQVNIRPAIWAIGGEKKGVGKSFIVSSLGISLSRSGNKVLLIDADPVAGDLHTFFGIEGNHPSYINSFQEESSDIRNLISKTPIPNVDFISGAYNFLSMDDSEPDSYNIMNIMKLHEVIPEEVYDYVLIDIGTGTSFGKLDLFLMADNGILITTPDIPSDDTCHFLEQLFSHQLKKIIGSQQNVKQKMILQKTLQENTASGSGSTEKLIMHLKELANSEGIMINTLLTNINISIIINQTKSKEDRYLGDNIIKSCYNYFGIEVGYLGLIHYDNSVGNHIRTGLPLINYYSKTDVSKAIDDIKQRLLTKKNQEILTANIPAGKDSEKENFMSKRLYEREETSIWCNLKKGKVRYYTEIVNISKLGAGIKVKGGMPLGINDKLNIAIKDIGVKKAQVVWIQPVENMHKAGLRFS